jgi:ATP-binding cassette, subfamily B, bacterial
MSPRGRSTVRPKPVTGAWATVVRGVRLSPELRVGLPATLVLALVATAGRAIVPVAVQQTVDAGLGGGQGPVDLDAVTTIVLAAGAAVLLTMLASAWMNVRLARVVETALSSLRVRAFRHIHDLSMLHQASQQRGSLVSRVTSDVDEISRFMQWAGLNLITASGQLLVATAVMAVYSWRLTLVVLVTFVPFVLLARWFQKRLTGAYMTVRERVAAMLGVLAETVVGAPVVRAYGIEERTRQRLDERIEQHRQAGVRAGRLVSWFSGSGEIFAALATGLVVVAGVLLGVDDQVSAGTVLAFLFLITLFVDPVLIAAEVINEGQTAVAGWRRVLDILDVEPDVADPPHGRKLPPGPLGISFSGVGFAYPVRHREAPDGPSRTPTDPDSSASPPDPSAPADGDAVPTDAASVPRDGASAAPTDAGVVWALRDVTVELPARRRIAVVGETGSGKTTFAKLLTRLMDPTEGEVRIGGLRVDEVAFSSLRRRVVMVPQEGALFDGTIAENVRQGRPELTDEELDLAVLELGLTDWVEELPDGTATAVGERGSALSAGERQLVAIARAYVANPDLLVLDEATSAVDPATEVRLQRALAGLTSGRTTVTIAHRLSTSEAADLVLVFDRGRLVEVGAHEELVGAGGVYTRLHDSWVAGTGA